MSHPAANVSLATGVRVGLQFSDTEQREALATRLISLGHRIVDSESAEVIITSDRGITPDVVLLISTPNSAGHLPFDCPSSVLDAAIRAVAAGLNVQLPKAAFALEEMSVSKRDDLLTPRELEVLEGISAGLSNKAIARKLGISLHTVKFHVESLFHKLGARSRAEAVARAIVKRSREMIQL
jgi:DNA-binding NarL/FixJ family response regulator